MSDLEPYLVEFNSERNIEEKVYPDDYQIGGENCWLVIVIIHDECTISANDRKIHKWQCKRDTFLCLKGKERGIIISDFLLLFSRLNLLCLPEVK